MIRKVISGGQTGADRGGLNAAIACNIEHGGLCPKGRRAEDGKIPQKYNLQETVSANYLVRTEKNVTHADATIVFSSGKLSGGSKKTVEFAKKWNKEWLHIDIATPTLTIVESINSWLENLPDDIVLNIAGPRESKARGMEKRVKEILVIVFQKLANSK